MDQEKPGKLLHTELKIYGPGGMMLQKILIASDRKTVTLFDHPPMVTTITKIEMEHVYEEVKP